MWEQFFLDFFDRSAEQLGVVLNAWSCREGWLQGELYRLGCDRGLRVNEYKFSRYEKADACCFAPPKMVAEIKILGGDYEPKMRFALDSDAERLKAIPDTDVERYLILIIPNSQKRGVLAQHLSGVCYSGHCVEREYAQFRLRLWRLETSPVASTLEAVQGEGEGV